MRRNLLFGAVTVALFFALLEGALRLSGRVSTDALRSPDIETLETIPGLFQPGQDLIDRIVPELPYHIHINSLGFRGREFALRKEPGTVRILCLGDSYTFGHYVEDSEAFPAVLEQLLNATSSRMPRRAQTVNGGANGFTILDELDFLREKGLALDPDFVILSFSQNDIEDLDRARPVIELMRDHARLKSTFIIGPIVKVLQHTAIFNAMQRTAAWLKIQRRTSTGHPAPGTRPDLWERYRALLGEVRDVVERHGSGFLLVVWPSWRQIEGIDPPAPQEKLALWAREMGIDHLDLLPVLSELERSGVKATFAPLDGHPSPRAHEAAARAIAQRLIERIASMGATR